jgi:hypothetical protein
MLIDFESIDAIGFTMEYFIAEIAFILGNFHGSLLFGRMN